MFDIATQIENDAWVSELANIGEFVEGIREATLTCLGSGVAVGEICCVFSDNDHVAALNETFRKKSGPTNVLAFPATGLSPDAGIDQTVGDVVLALEIVEKEARNQGKKFADHAAHLMVHGILHLFGYDHESEPGAKRMENVEKRILGELRIDDPYETDKAHIERTN